MTLTLATYEELHELIGSLCDGAIEPLRFARLQELLAADIEAQQFYVRYLDLHGVLHRLEQRKEEQGKEERGTKNEERGLGTSVPSEASTAFPIPDLSVPHSSFIIHHSAFPSSYIGGALFSYLTAAVILSVGLAIAWVWKLPDHSQIVRQSVPLHSPSSATHYPLSTIHSFVGRITGMVDCQWDDPNTATLDRAHVPLGRRYALASGLMEITYDTGARVILQGPVTYEVDSAAGGFLSLGKLTARVESSTEYGVRSTKETGTIARQRSEIRNPKSEISPLSPLPSPLFTIKTPTATVTDLGTEFGVEVDKQGNTTSHVFRGAVKVQAVAIGGEAEGDSQVLRENESARVEKDSGKQGGGNRVPVFVTPAKPVDFVRSLAPTLKTLDLADVVAGGDGFSGRRSGGIDPSNGRATNTPPTPKGIGLGGDGKYHRVETLPLVDGVFIPNGRDGDVQVDSAGHAFGRFPATDNNTYGYVWAGGIVPTDQPYPRLTELDGVDYTSAGHRVLFLHANKGITFDLEAIRQANPGCKLLRFRATAGNAETFSENGDPYSADLWVIVDGRERFGRYNINRAAGAFTVLVSLRESDRFLTLAATEGSNGTLADWIVFGDPRLELLSAAPATNSTPQRMK